MRFKKNITGQQLPAHIAVQPHQSDTNWLFVCCSFLCVSIWVVTGCSTSQPEIGYYLTDSNSSSDDTGTGQDDTATGSDSASDTNTAVDCNDIKPCSEHGRCVEKDGVPTCECDDGWMGNTCDDCLAGWHVVGDECVLDEQCLPTSCAFHEVDGGCDVEDGEVVCECEGKWDAGNHCATCLPGYHEEDDECVEDLYCINGSQPCEHGGICSEESGQIVCDCSVAGDSRVDGENWTGEFCEICPEGFHVTGDDCIPNAECTSSACGDNGTCVVAESGSALCVCSTGWTHSDVADEFSPCDECAQGYHHPDGDESLCVEDEKCEALSCGVGTCTENDSGGIDCVCPEDTVLDPEFNCGKCLPTYHWVIGVGCVANDDSCDMSDPCGSHGTCVYDAGEKSCDCDPMYTGQNCDSCINGYQDRDNNGVCAPNCATAEDNGLDCGTNGNCDDTTGVAVCDCSGGWAGASCDVCPDGNHLDSGDCVINDTCEPDSCNSHGTCTVPSETGIVQCDCDDGWIDDFSGNRCAVCASGYQNSISSDDCQPTCATAVSDGLDCGDNGACALNTVTGAPHCACNTGYAGDDCSLCDGGYHLEGVICIANDASCDVNDPCGDHGTCVYEGGIKSCRCDTLYTGATCLNCVSGYQDSNADGTCRPNCTTAQANGMDCGDNGLCVLAGGLAKCDCDVGYTGADCGTCDTEYHWDAGACEPDEVCSSATGPCVNGDCSVVGGFVQCTCEAGWATDGNGYCTVCASGYHLDTGNCVIDEVCEDGVSCSGRGTCLLVDGLVTCTSCTGGFTITSLCASCPTGFHESGGVCVLSESCNAGSCNDHGTCSDSSGVVVCSCDDVWTGETCDSCIAGYHDDGGSCVFDETCIASSCSYHGDCDDSSGVVVCTCDDPAAYEQPYCADCKNGYHKDGTTGDCVINEICEAGDPSPSCNSHGSCDVSTGVVVCSCESEWTGSYCTSCAIGFHLDSGDCVADVACSTVDPDDLDPSCNGRGKCADGSGSVVCDCSVTGPGWDADSNCGTCADGYHDEDGDCVENETCEAGNPSPSCNGHGTCNDSTGVIVCTCELGFLGDDCTTCDTGDGYSACASDCCNTDEVCSGGTTCVTPLTCDDVPEVDFTECGLTTVSDGAGGNIDCGDCGNNGTCVGGTCECDDNYGVLDGEHECTYACDGYLPSENCCASSDWVVYCSDGNLRTTYCGYFDAPGDVCGWSTDFENLTCSDEAIPQEFLDAGVTEVCPSNIVVDTSEPVCDDDASEENDSDDLTAPLLADGAIVWGVKCPNDPDFYRIYLEAGQTVTATLTFPHSNGNLDLELGYEWLDDENYSQFVLWSSTGADVEEVEFTAGDAYPYYDLLGAGVYPEQYTAAGDYYLKIWASEFVYNSYVLEVQISP